jgi:hypothetical protein
MDQIAEQLQLPSQLDNQKAKELRTATQNYFGNKPHMTRSTSGYKQKC